MRQHHPSYPIQRSPHSWGPVRPLFERPVRPQCVKRDHGPPLLLSERQAGTWRGLKHRGLRLADRVSFQFSSLSMETLNCNSSNCDACEHCHCDSKIGLHGSSSESANSVGKNDTTKTTVGQRAQFKHRSVTSGVHRQADNSEPAPDFSSGTERRRLSQLMSLLMRGRLWRRAASATLTLWPLGQLLVSPDTDVSAVVRFWVASPPQWSP
jgi:hypothetical protein